MREMGLRASMLTGLPGLGMNVTSEVIHYDGSGEPSHIERKQWKKMVGEIG